MQADKLMLAKEAMSRAHIMHDDQQHEVVCVWPADWTAIRALLAIAEGADADRADARRYRWLRDSKADDLCVRTRGDNPIHPHLWAYYEIYGGKLDAAIDAALAGAVTQGQPEG